MLEFGQMLQWKKPNLAVCEICVQCANCQQKNIYKYSCEPRTSRRTLEFVHPRQYAVMPLIILNKKLSYR